jgi:hypothetical protein
VVEAVQSASARTQTRITLRQPDAGHDFPHEVRDEAYQFLARTLGAL